MSLTSDKADVVFARPLLGDDEIAAVVRVLSSGLIAQGPEVAAFESEFAEAVGAVDAVAVSSGTAALEVCLEALNVGEGDEVIVPAFTFIATAAAAVRAGARVRFADVDPVTFCIDPESVSKLLTPRTKAVIPVDLFGYPAPVTDIEALIGPSTAVIEDAAQAHGARRGQNSVGGSGTVTFSFYPTKNMTTAEGGMLLTERADLAEAARLIRNQGMGAQYDYARLGTNLRMTDIGAALGRTQLTRLDGFVRRRSEIADRYRADLDFLQVPEHPPAGRHAWSCFTISHPQRDALRVHLAACGVSTKIYYPESLHRLSPFASEDDCPVADALAETALSLPIRPDLSDAEIERVIEAVKGF